MGTVIVGIVVFGLIGVVAARLIKNVRAGTGGCSCGNCRAGCHRAGAVSAVSAGTTEGAA